jgi:hypothetical protein
VRRHEFAERGRLLGDQQVALQEQLGAAAAAHDHVALGRDDREAGAGALVADAQAARGRSSPTDFAKVAVFTTPLRNSGRTVYSGSCKETSTGCTHLHPPSQFHAHTSGHPVASSRQAAIPQHAATSSPREEPSELARTNPVRSVVSAAPVEV